MKSGRALRRFDRGKDSITIGNMCPMFMQSVPRSSSWMKCVPTHPTVKRPTSRMAFARLSPLFRTLPTSRHGHSYAERQPRPPLRCQVPARGSSPTASGGSQANHRRLLLRNGLDGPVECSPVSSASNIFAAYSNMPLECYPVSQILAMTCRPAKDRLWRKADVWRTGANVRFWRKARHRLTKAEEPFLSAKRSGRSSASGNMS